MSDDPNIETPNSVPFDEADWANSKSLLEYAASQPVFFHAGSGCDWNPIARFTDVCRVFISCSETNYDPKFPPFALEDCPRSLRTLFGQESCGSLDGDVLRQSANLKTFRQGHWSRVERKIEVKRGEGRDARPLYGVERKLFLAFIQAEPVEAFQRLFADRGVGPKFVCLHLTHKPGGLCELLANAGAARPKYVVGQWPELYPPWTLLWQKYRSWGDTAVFQLRDAPPHQLQDAANEGNLHWVGTPLNPATVEGAQAVHLTIQEYLACRWPAHIQRIFLDAHEAGLPAEFWATDPRLSPLPLSGLPISKALPKLANACDEADIQTIHTGRFGFEDETDALRGMWPRHCRFLLTIHCETQGDMGSLQGYVCDDLPPPA